MCGSWYFNNVSMRHEGTVYSFPNPINVLLITSQQGSTLSALLQRKFVLGSLCVVFVLLHNQEAILSPSPYAVCTPLFGTEVLFNH